MNGRIWVRSDTNKHTVAISMYLKQCEHLSVADAVMSLRHTVKALGWSLVLGFMLLSLFESITCNTKIVKLIRNEDIVKMTPVWTGPFDYDKWTVVVDSITFVYLILNFAVDHSVLRNPTEAFDSSQYMSCYLSFALNFEPSWWGITYATYSFKNMLFSIKCFFT